jgi:hypothetical protein
VATYLSYKRVEPRPTNATELAAAMKKCEGVEPASGDTTKPVDRDAPQTTDGGSSDLAFEAEPFHVRAGRMVATVEHVVAVEPQEPHVNAPPRRSFIYGVELGLGSFSLIGEQEKSTQVAGFVGANVGWFVQPWLAGVVRSRLIDVENGEGLLHVTGGPQLVWKRVWFYGGLGLATTRSGDTPEFAPELAAGLSVLETRHSVWSIGAMLAGGGNGSLAMITGRYQRR